MRIIQVSTQGADPAVSLGRSVNSSGYTSSPFIAAIHGHAFLPVQHVGGDAALMPVSRCARARTADINYEMVTKKLREIITSRGRRGTDKAEQVEMLQFLATIAKGPAQRFEVMAQLVSSLFDLNPGMSGHLKTSVWKKCVNQLLEMLKLLEENPHVQVRLVERVRSGACVLGPYSWLVQGPAYDVWATPSQNVCWQTPEGVVCCVAALPRHDDRGAFGRGGCR